LNQDNVELYVNLLTEAIEKGDRERAKRIVASMINQKGEYFTNSVLNIVADEISKVSEEFLREAVRKLIKNAFK
jgi:hypothetical protein